MRYAQDDFVVAVATDAPDELPVPTGLPVFDLNAPAEMAAWLQQQGERFDYDWELHGEAKPCAHR